MVLIERAAPPDRLDVERLIAAYLTSEGVKPRPERITWAVEQVMRNRVGGVLLVAREKRAVVGVALAVYSPSAEEGRLLVLNDFFVDPAMRRKGVGRALATRLLEEAKAMRVERIDLEVTPTNAPAATFWKSMGFRTGGRTVRASRGSRGSGPRPRSRGVSSAGGGTPSSVFPSVAVRDLRGHERVAERAFELRPEFDDANAHSRFDADRVAEAEVRARAVGANDLLVRQDGSLDAHPGREAAVRSDRFDLDHSRSFFVQEAWMRDVSDAGDSVPAPEVLVQACAANLARRALGLRPAVDEFVARVRLPLADERDLDHTRASPGPKARCGLRVSVPRRSPDRPRRTDSRADRLKVDVTMARDGRVDKGVPAMMSCIVFRPAPGAP